MHDSLAGRGHQLSVHSEDLTTGANEQQGIVERSTARLRVTLVDPDSNVHTSRARSIAQLRDGRAGNGHRLIEQLGV